MCLPPMTLEELPAQKRAMEHPLYRESCASGLGTRRTLMCRAPYK
jgi:hypothetical protein